MPIGAADVRFCFAFPYQAENLRAFLKRHDGSPNLKVETLCRTKKGREVELLLAGTQHDFPVVQDGAMSGLLTRAALVSALGERGPESLRAAFRAFALDYQVSGRFSDCLDRLQERLSDPVGDRVVESLRVAREVGGGDLGRLLRSLSGFLPNTSVNVL